MNESDKLEIMTAFFFASRRTRKRNSTRMHSIKTRFVTEPSNVLFAGVYVCNV